MSKMTGTGKDDWIVTSDTGDEVTGRAGNDQIDGGLGNDVLLAGGGDDVVVGGAGDDIIYGSNKTPGGFNEFLMAEDYNAHVVFKGESAGYKNALGAYTYDADGNITGVKILFANASLVGSGGDLVSGVSGADIALAKGERIGFFVVPNGFAQNGANAALLAQAGGTFVLKDADGASNVMSGKALTLSWNDGTTEHVITSQYGQQLFHSLMSLNGDGLDHVRSKINPVTGQVEIGFEDLLNGGDKDYDDSVFTVDVGVKTAQAWIDAQTRVGNDDDKLSGGEGRDTIYGMRGNDTIDGGKGDDALYGNSGDDQMLGGDGNDVMGGGKGNDVMAGNAGNDSMRGDSGNDVMRDGFGDDNVKGGNDNDTVFAGAGGKDVYEGGKGSDTLDFSEMGGKSGVKLNLSKSVATQGAFTDTVKGFETVIGTKFNDRFTGSKNADVLWGADGDDYLRGKQGSDELHGGAGADTFRYEAGDWVRGSLDHIADFQMKTDMLDLHELMSGKNAGKLAGVSVKDTDDGTLVMVQIDGKFRSIAVLDDVHGVTVADLYDAGSLII